MARRDFAFHHSFRVRWSETDAQGIVFNARYLDYADIAITEYWRAAAVREKAGADAFETHVKRATITYQAPIKPDEMITVMARTARVGTTSITQIIEIHGEEDDQQDDLRAEIELVHVYVDLEHHRPRPVPDNVRAIFADFDAKAMVPA